MSSDSGGRGARVLSRAWALFAMFRNGVLVLAVLAAGTIGGYAGSILAAIDLSNAGRSDHSLGVPGIEAIYVKNQVGTFEELGRAVDQFNAQLGENWEVWESLGRYIVGQGWSELKRAWGGPVARPSASSDI